VAVTTTTATGGRLRIEIQYTSCSYVFMQNFVKQSIAVHKLLC